MNPYVIGGTALLIIVLGWQLKASVTRNGELTAKLETQVSETLECAVANESNLTTVTTLEERIIAMVDERRADTVRREEILDERDQELATVRADAQRLRDERLDDFNETTDCTDLASLNVGFFCPTVAGELRERSAGEGSN